MPFSDVTHPLGQMVAVWCQLAAWGLVSMALIKWVMALLLAAMLMPLRVAPASFASLPKTGTQRLLKCSVRRVVLSLPVIIVQVLWRAIGLKTIDWGVALSTL